MLDEDFWETEDLLELEKVQEPHSGPFQEEWRVSSWEISSDAPCRFWTGGEIMLAWDCALIEINASLDVSLFPVINHNNNTGWD